MDVVRVGVLTFPLPSPPKKNKKTKQNFFGNKIEKLFERQNASSDEFFLFLLRSVLPVGETRFRDGALL